MIRDFDRKRRAKADYSPEETAKLDAEQIANAVRKGANRSRIFGSSKHRSARVQKFLSSQKRKKRSKRGR